MVFHSAMFPWFGIGHITPFLHLSNRLAERGCRVSFLIPIKTKDKFEDLNLHPDLINFIPLTLPPLDDLPPGAETVSDVSLHNLAVLTKAFDLTRDQVQIALKNLQPHAIFFDYAHWLPSLAHSLGIKTIFFAGTTPSLIASYFVPAIKSLPTEDSCDTDTISVFDRVTTVFRESDVICFRGCAELYGSTCNYIENQCKKQVFLLGKNLPEPSKTPLEGKWAKWLGLFGKGSVVYCAFGSECVLERDQFQELVLGLELTGMPFLVRLKPPSGVETVEEALPEGFEERVRGRGVVYGEWVQQQQILNHPSVGCFVSHSGYGSMWESLTSTPQLVLVPQNADHFANAKFMTQEIEVGLEVERREGDGWFSRHSLCEAVKLVMDLDSEIGKKLRANHLRWMEILSNETLDSTHLANFITKLQDILLQ